MSRRVSSERAGEIYLARHGRAAGTDAWTGLFIATVAELLSRGAQALDQAGRRARQGRLREPASAVPDWFEHGLHAMDRWVRDSPAALPPPLGAVIGVVPVEELLAWMDESRELVLPPALDPARMGALAKRLGIGGAAKRAPWAFYLGVRAWFLARHGVEPKPSELTLLAGHVGLQRFERAEKARRQWEDRIRLWRRQTPPEFEQWVEPWRAMGGDALDAVASRAVAALEATEPGPKS